MLGRKVGEGAGSEVYEWGDDQVVKLFKAGESWSTAQYETWATRTIQNSGAPAPEVLGVVMVDERIGIILPRYHGPNLLNLLIEGKVTPESAGEVMGKIHYSLHEPEYKVAIRTFRDWVLGDLSHLGGRGVPEDVLNKVREVLMTLPEGDTLCHADLHPANVIMTADGPKIVDWINALQGNRWVDISRLHITLSVYLISGESFGVDTAFLDEIRRRMDTTFLATYSALCSIPMKEMLDNIEPYMTVFAATRMCESSSTQQEKELLIEYVRGR